MRKFVCAVFIFIPAFGFALKSGYKPVYKKGDASFEWKNSENSPKRIFGAGKVLKCAVSPKNKFCAFLTTTGIEIFDLKSKKFVKKLLLKQRVVRIFFSKNSDEHVFYKTREGKTILWGIFNFSFKQIHRKIKNKHSACDFNKQGFVYKIKYKGNEFAIYRPSPDYYRFAYEKASLKQTGNKYGVVYSFEDKNYSFVKDKVYNIYGNPVSISKNDALIITKTQKGYALFDTKTGKVLKHFGSSKTIFIHNKNRIINYNDKTLYISTIRGRVLKRVKIESKIRNVTSNSYGICVSADKTYVLDNNGNIKSETDIRSIKAYATENGFLGLIPYRGKRNLIIRIKKGKRENVAVVYEEDFVYEKGVIYYKFGKGIKVLGLQGLNYIKNAKQIIKTRSFTFAIIGDALFLINKTNLQNVYIKINGAVITNGNTIYFEENNALHSFTFSEDNINFLSSINENDFIKLANKKNENEFLQKIIYNTLLYYFPLNKNALKKSADFYYKKKYFSISLDLYLKLLKLGYRKKEVYRGLGISAIKQRDYKTAVKYLRVSIRYYPKDYTVHYYLGTAYYRIGAYGAGIRYLNASIRLNKDFMKAYQNLGLLYRKIKRYSLSEKTYLKGLSINEKADELYFNLGRLYEITGKFPVALLCFKEAFELKSQDEYYSYQVAQIYIKLKKWDMALNYLKQTLRINKNYAPAQFNLGYIYETQKNNKTLAAYHYNYFLKLRPESRYKKRIKRFLTNR